MCRNIKRLRRPEASPTDQELHDAALQFVRKISGYNAPSQANRVAFDTAVDDVATAARRMFESLHVRVPVTVRTGEGVNRENGRRGTT